MRYLFLLFITQSTFASIAELYSGASSTMGLGNQPNFNQDDASNNFILPSLLAFSKNTGYSLNTSFVRTNFTKISNVVTENKLNSSSNSEKYGNVDPNYGTEVIASLHGSFKIFKSSDAKFLISFFGPYDKLLEANTGDSYLPQYAAYNSRLQRMLLQFHLTNTLSDTFSYSIGVITGTQSSGETYIVARENGEPFSPSLGKMKINATPSIAPAFSILKKWNLKNSSYLSYTSMMKSNFTNEAGGITPVGSSSLKYDWTFNSMFYYDPLIIRLGHNLNLDKINLYATLEYQGWDAFKSPKLEMINNGGILAGTKDFEKIETQNIVVPKFAISFADANSTYQAGLSYRPSHLKGEFKDAGNIVDTSSTILSLGYLRNLTLLDTNFSLNIATQYHYLEDKKIIKSDKTEDLSEGSKIGSPGYSIGGSIFVLSFGLNWVL